MQTNTAKLKLLVRSHAMRESTSPPREPHGGNGSSSPHSPQSADGEKRIVCSLSPNSNGAKLNNNESMYNSNLCPAQSPKQMRNTATSPTCRTPSRNGEIRTARSSRLFFSPLLRFSLNSRTLFAQVNLVPLRYTHQRASLLRQTAISWRIIVPSSRARISFRNAITA